MQVYTKALERASGNLNREFHKENAQIFGNKRVVVVLTAQPSDQNANIPFAITSQKDETGADVSKFAYDDTTNLLTPVADIDNVKLLKFHHNITYTGSTGSGGNNDANQVLEVNQRIVGAITEIEEIDKISSAIALGANETLKIRKVTGPEPQADPTNDWGISSLISLGWSLREFNTPVIKCTGITVTVEINYYDENAIGGN